jgi:ATP-dependent helicase HrpA
MKTFKYTLRRSLEEWQFLTGGRRNCLLLPTKPCRAEKVFLPVTVMNQRHYSSPEKQQAPTVVPEWLDRAYVRSLPIALQRAEIVTAIRANQVVIVTGETGCGKTTQLPLMCLEARGENAGTVVVAQPRRIAAISLANYVASLMPNAYKNFVSYKVRFHGNEHPGTKILFATDGIILAETTGDTLLSKYETILIDEAHERNLSIDFLLGYLRSLLLRRNELKLIIASATMDTKLFSRCFRNAPVITVRGRSYPVEIRYAPPIGLWQGSAMRPCVDSVIHAVQSIVDSNEQGDILAFLPTVDDIHECHTGLVALMKSNACDIATLFGRMNPGEQEAIFIKSARRKIILATNIAETSVTVPNIRFVVDSGLARCVRFDSVAGITRMPVERISKASADQRAGRCGRVREGVCIRLYSQADYASMPRGTLPEIRRANLAGVILRLMNLGFGKPKHFPFVQPPPPCSLDAAYRQLRFLGAFDHNGALTKTGRAMAALPLDPAIARMVLYAQENNAFNEVAIIASALSVGEMRIEGTRSNRGKKLGRGDPRSPTQTFNPAELDKSLYAGIIYAGRIYNSAAESKGYTSDFMELVIIWRNLPRTTIGKISRRRLQEFCETQGFSLQRVREWINIHWQLIRICKRFGRVQQRLPASYEQVHKSLLSALAGNIAEAGEDGSYTTCRMHSIKVSPASRLFKTRHDWVLLHDIAETNRPYARYAAVIEPHWIQELFARQCRTTYEQPGFDIETGEVVCLRQVTFNGLHIVKNQRINFSSARPEEAQEVFINEALIGASAGEKYDFLFNNNKIINKIECMQRKLRTRCLYRGDQALFDFYHSRLPGVASITQLNASLGRVKNDRFLYVQESDLLNESLPGHCGDYPDSILVAGVEMPVSYVFEPESAMDGATAVVPLTLFQSVPGFFWEWLLPVFWRQRIVEIIRQIAPVVASQELDHRVEEVKSLLMPGKGPFMEQALAALQRIFGLPEIRDYPSLSPHLWLHLCIVDKNGIIIETIQPPIRVSSLPRIQLGLRPMLWQQWCKDWECEDISDFKTFLAFQAIAVNSPGQHIPLPAIAGLAVENDRVCRRVFFNRGAAYGAHRQSVRLLLERALNEKIAWVWRDFLKAKLIPLKLRERMDILKITDSLELIFNELILHCAKDLPEDQEAFDRLKEKALARMATAGAEAVALMTAILPEYEACQLFLEKWKASRSTPFGQAQRLKTLECLFQSSTDIFFNPSGKGEKLARLPRYFRGFLFRLHMATDKPKHYEECVQMLLEFEDTAHRLRNLHESNLPEMACKLNEYEEMIEEYALAIFAHGQIPTRFPVSKQRLSRCKETLINTLSERRGGDF